MKCFCLFAVLIVVAPCAGQVLRSALPVAYTSAGTYSQHFTDPFSFVNNQAALSRVRNISAGIYSERRFMLRDLEQVSMAVAFPCMRGGAGIAADYTGFAGYSQTQAGIAYGRPLGEKIDLGIQFNYHHLGIAGYGGTGALNIEIGTILHLTNKIQAGYHIYNLVGGKFGRNSGEKLASIYTFGLGYEASEKLFIASEIIKEEDQPVNMNVSIHYAFVKQFFIRAGISSATGSYFAGAGISWKNTRLDLASGWHPQAGLTPSLLFIFMLTHHQTDPE
jgi:hypothetical protein